MINLIPKNIERFKRDILILSLSPKEKRLVRQWTAQDIKKNAQANINKQKSPDGISWEPRKKQIDLEGLKGKGRREAKKKNKMLKHRAQYLNTRLVGSPRAIIGYTIPRTAQISSIHQYGLIDSLPSKDIDGNKKVNQSNNRATTIQAARLKALGYTAPKDDKKRKAAKTDLKKSDYAIIQRKWRERILNGKNRRAVSEEEIIQTLTIGQAGLLIRLLDPQYNQKEYRKRFNERKGVKPLPKRTFLDMDEERNAKRMTAAILRIQKQKK